jgi:hypothetical protein
LSKQIQKTVRQVFLLAFIGDLALGGCSLNAEMTATRPRSYSAKDVPSAVTEALKASREEAALPCLLSSEERKKYSSAKEITHTVVSAPTWWARQHIAGCVGIEFQIDGNGVSSNFRTVKEHPTGIGLPQFAIERISQTQFLANADPNRWYYRETVMAGTDY